MACCAHLPSYRYEPGPIGTLELREQLVKLARQKTKFRYRKVHGFGSRLFLPSPASGGRQIPIRGANANFQDICT
jgi:hypothetical protein